MLFCAWLLTVGRILLRFIHVVTGVTILFFPPPWDCIPLYAFTTLGLSICQLIGLAYFQSCHQALVTSYNWVLRVITILTLQMKCLAVNLLGRVKGRLEPHWPNSKCTLWFLKTTSGFSYKPGQSLSPSSVKIPSPCASQGFPGKGSHLPPACCCQPSSKNIPRLQRPGNQFQLSRSSVCPKRPGLISCSEEEDSDVWFGLDPAPQGRRASTLKHCPSLFDVNLKSSQVLRS